MRRTQGCGETAGEVFGKGQPACACAVCMERVEGCRVVLSVFFGLHEAGTTSE